MPERIKWIDEENLWNYKISSSRKSKFLFVCICERKLCQLNIAERNKCIDEESLRNYKISS
jgi:hypothetical protein